MKTRTDKLIKLIFRATREQWQNPVTRIFFILGPIFGLICSSVAFWYFHQSHRSLATAIFAAVAVTGIMWTFWSAFAALAMAAFGIRKAYENPRDFSIPIAGVSGTRHETQHN